MTNGPKIFISYRRDDTSGYNLTVYDQMGRRFGKGRIFMDIDNIKPGQDFRKVLQGAVGQCDALIALIGPKWLTATDEEGRRRLDNPQDWVRLEISAALDRENLLVIPALVRGAHMPPPTDLPGDLRDLAFRHAVELRDSTFISDIRRLAKDLETALIPAESRSESLPSGKPASPRRTRARHHGIGPPMHQSRPVQAEETAEPDDLDTVAKERHETKVPISTQIAELPISEFLTERAGKLLAERAGKLTNLLKAKGVIGHETASEFITCPNCSRPIPANAKLCRYCGARITS